MYHSYPQPPIAFHKQPIHQHVQFLIFLFPYERECLAHDAVRQVHARLAQPLKDRSGLGYPGASLCRERQTESPPYGNP
jgi:hypothetical protein